MTINPKAVREALAQKPKCKHPEDKVRDTGKKAWCTDCGADVPVVEGPREEKIGIPGAHGKGTDCDMSAKALDRYGYIVGEAIEQREEVPGPAPQVIYFDEASSVDWAELTGGSSKPIPDLLPRPSRHFEMFPSAEEG